MSNAARGRRRHDGRGAAGGRHGSQNGISELVRVRINGLDQGMFIEARDQRAPVLLYLHGGMPDHFLDRRRPSGLAQDFVVVWWEQRGSGLSYRRGIPRESLTPEQLIADTVELTDYLRWRFGREKVYLMGHSGGTFIGIQAAAQHPDRYHAYVGVAQMTHQLESEALAHRHMVEEFTARGDRRMVRRLQLAPVGTTVPLPRAYLSVRDVAMHRLGVGTTHDMTSVITGIVLPSLVAPEYTLGQRVNLWRGKLRTSRYLWNAQLATDLRQTVRRVDLPVYFVHGAWDHTVSYDLARSYFDALEAPVKGFYTFPASAHSPLFEEPDRMRRILIRDVLIGATRLADAASRPAGTQADSA